MLTYQGCKYHATRGAQWLRYRLIHGLNCLPSRPNVDLHGRVSFRAKIEGFPKRIHVHEGAAVRESAWLRCLDEQASIEIGTGTLIMPYAKLVASQGSLIIGRDCTIHSFDALYGFAGGLTIGNGVNIGTHVAIISGNHVFDDMTRPINEQGSTSKGIRIEDYVWIGNGVSVLDGVTIGSNAVLGAGCVVTRDVAPDSVCVGVPARCIRKRGELPAKAPI